MSGAPTHKWKERELTRKEFLMSLSLALLSVLGFQNFINLLRGNGTPAQKRAAQESEFAGGFGSRKFGA